MGDVEETIGINLIKSIVDFLADNFPYIVLLIILYMFRAPISGLISRVINVKIKRGESEIGVEAALPSSIDKGVSFGATDKLPSEESDVLDNEKLIEAEPEEFFMLEIHKAFGRNEIVEAKSIFNKYEREEKNPIVLQKNRAFYLYMLFKFGKDNGQ